MQGPHRKGRPAGSAAPEWEAWPGLRDPGSGGNSPHLQRMSGGKLLNPPLMTLSSANKLMFIGRLCPSVAYFQQQMEICIRNTESSYGSAIFLIS